MEKDIRVLVVDDHQVVREGLRQLLGQEEDIEIIGQGTNAEEVLFQIELLSPNIVLMDIKMPEIDGIELTRQIIQKYPSCKVIMLTLYDEYLSQAMEAGAKGYLLKDIHREQLTQAIRKVHSGEVVIHESIASQPIFGYGEGHIRKTEQAYGTTIEEVQLVLLPPIDAKQLIRFTGRTEETLQCRVVQLVGSWQDGTIITVILNKGIAIADIMNKLENIPEVEAIKEKPLTGETSPGLLRKTITRPKLENRPKITLLVTLEKDHTGMLNSTKE
ncbi:response regulator transcription factor [Chloroflexota bacterium]